MFLWKGCHLPNAEQLGAPTVIWQPQKNDGHGLAKLQDWGVKFFWGLGFMVWSLELNLNDFAVGVCSKPNLRMVLPLWLIIAETLPGGVQKFNWGPTFFLRIQARLCHGSQMPEKLRLKAIGSGTGTCRVTMATETFGFTDIIITRYLILPGYHNSCADDSIRLLQPSKCQGILKSAWFQNTW